MKRLILALALLSCSGNYQYHCKSICGAMYYGSWATQEDAQGWSCGDFQDAENRILREYPKTVTDPRFTKDNICKMLDGTSVWTSTSIHWIDRWGRDVAGITTCENKVIQANNAPIIFSSYYHEVAHIVQNCSAPLPVDMGTDSDHADWYRDQIFQTISGVYGRHD